MAIVERNFVRDMTTPYRDGDVVLGDDWVAPDKTATDELRSKRARRGLFSLRASPLTRKIITFNLIALNVLAAGILYLNSSRDSLICAAGSRCLYSILPKALLRRTRVPPREITSVPKMTRR